MIDTIELFLAVTLGLGLVLTVAIVVYFALRPFQPDRQTKKAWETAAGQTGLSLHNPYFSLLRLDGTFRGCRVAVVAEPATMNVTARSRPATTCYVVRHARQEVPRLQLLPNRSGPSEELVELGVPKFDDRFGIACGDAAFARALFGDAEWRDRFLGLELPKVYLNSKELRLSEIGTQLDAAVLQDRLELAIALASRLDDTRPTQRE